MTADDQRTREQRLAIAVFDCFRVNSICFAGRWIWKQDIRNNPMLARAFVKRITHLLGAEPANGH